MRPRLLPSCTGQDGTQFCSVSCSAPKLGLALDVLAADDPGGAELCSLAPVDWSASLAGMPLLSAESVLPAAEFGPAELCSAAPPDVSALPDGGTVASFEASGETPGPVGC